MKRQLQSQHVIKVTPTNSVAQEPEDSSPHSQQPEKPDPRLSVVFRNKYWVLWGRVVSPRFGGKVYWWVDCYWWKTVWRTRALHYYILTENIKQLRVACSEFAFIVYCGCCDNILYIESHWNHHNTWKTCLLFVQWLWNKCFQYD
jgi:hypothetical protein